MSESRRMKRALNTLHERAYVPYQWPSGYRTHLPVRPLEMFKEAHRSQDISEMAGVKFGAWLSAESSQQGDWILANEALHFAIECYDPYDLRGIKDDRCSKKDTVRRGKWCEANLLMAAVTIFMFGGDLFCIEDLVFEFGIFNKSPEGQLAWFKRNYLVHLTDADVEVCILDMEQGVAPSDRFRPRERRHKARAS